MTCFPFRKMKSILLQMMSKKALSFFSCHNFSLSLFFYNIDFSRNRSLLVQVPPTTTFTQYSPYDGCSSSCTYFIS